MTNIVDIWNKSNEIFTKWVENGADGFIPKGCMFFENSNTQVVFISLGIGVGRRMGIWFHDKKELYCHSNFGSPSGTRYTHPPIEKFQDLFYDLSEKNKILLCLNLVNPLEEVKEEAV